MQNEEEDDAIEEDDIDEEDSDAEEGSIHQAIKKDDMADKQKAKPQK